MDQLILQGEGGPLGIVGRVYADSRAALLAVNGSFPPPGQLHDLITHFTGVSVVIVNLPGMGGAPWANATVSGLTESLEQTVRLLLPSAPIVAFGASTGNLLSLGLRLPNICRRVALEPFLETGELWPFIANSRERLEMNLPRAHTGHYAYLKDYLWEVFGVASDKLENRDYRRLLDNITVPTDVMVGELPLLPRRRTDIWPSFTSAKDRASLAANPLVTFHEGPAGTGHSYQSGVPTGEQLKHLLHAALRHAVKVTA
jgi:hypothetical protein